MKRFLLAAIIVALLISPALAMGGVVYNPTNGGTTNNTFITVLGGNVSATINVNYTFTGASSTQALVTNIGTPIAAVLDFTIPSGATGAQGIQGIQGVNGTPGDPGVQGIQGIQGVNGTPGINGAAATVNVNATFTGAPGSAATVTNIGTSAAALLNFQIPTGANGAQGVNGTPGDPGAQGIQGIQGIQGVNGTPGDPGVQGIQGIQGVNGTPGTNGAAATIAVNATFTGTAGSSATVTNIGNTSAALLNFGIPMGSSGTNGINGTNGTSAYVYGSPGGILYNIGNNATTDPCITYDNITKTFYACNLTGDGGNLFNITSTATGLALGVREEGTGTIYKGQAVYVSGSTGVNIRVGLVDNTITDKSRIIGLMFSDTGKNNAGQVQLEGYLTGVDTRATNPNVNPNGESWAAGDLLFSTSTGGLTNTRPTSGRSVKAAYTVYGSSISDTLLLYPTENPVWSTAASGENVVLRLGDNIGSTKVSIRNYANTEVASISSYGNVSSRSVNNITIISSPSDAVNKSYVDALTGGVGISYSTLRSADDHILLNMSTVNQWISLNKTQILTATLTNVTNAQAAALRAADDHISTNISSGVSYSTLAEADSHIASNKTAILSAESTNNTAAQAAAILASGNQIALNRTLILSGEIVNNTNAQYAALRAADDHIATNSSAGVSYATLLEADNHIASNKSAILSATLTNVTNAQYAALRAADDHIATNASAGGVPAADALYAADQHILTNMTLGAGSNQTVVVESEFLDPSTQAIPGFLGAAISSGTIAAVASDANHPGVIYMRDSTTAAGGYRYGCQGTQVLQGGEFFEVVFQPVGVRGTQASKFGWADTAAAATLPVDGVWFNVSGTGAVQTFMGATSSSSVRTYTPSYTTTTGTWYRGTISIAPGGAPVTYTLYSPSGAQLWQETLSASIPNATGRDTSPCIIVSETSTDAAANILLLDYVRWGTTKVLSR